MNHSPVLMLILARHAHIGCRCRRRQVRLQAALLAAWRSSVAAAALKRKQQLQAFYLYAFVALTKGLRGLREYANRRAATQQLKQLAFEHWARVYRARALAAWRAAIVVKRARAVAGDAAAEHAERTCQRRALAVWRAAAAVQGAARRQGEAALAAVGARLLGDTVAAALGEWQVGRAAWVRCHRHERGPGGSWGMSWGTGCQGGTCCCCALVFICVAQHWGMGRWRVRRGTKWNEGRGGAVWGGMDPQWSLLRCCAVLSCAAGIRSTPAAAGPAGPLRCCVPATLAPAAGHLGMAC